MRRRKDLPIEPRDLRARAEERLQQYRTSVSLQHAASDLQRLLHELEIQHIELEMQNQELRTARSELEEGLSRYTELFDFAPIGYATIDGEELICEVNHVAARLLGSPRARLVGASFAALIAPIDRMAFSALLGRALDSESSERSVLMLGSHAPSVRYIALTARVLAGSERRILLAFEDVTEQRAQEQKLLATEQALREADQHKDQFLALLSHELRNPLAPIRNSLYLLAHTKAESEHAHKAREIISRQVEHMTRLVDDLLDVARIAHGKIELRRELLDVNELLRRAVDDLRACFEASQIRLEARYAAEPLWVDGDSVRLMQALSNLLANAEKYTPAGGSVVVSAAREANEAVLRVRDTGVGIAPELLPQVFDPFAQAPQSEARARARGGLGLGLGLAMVKGLVELHDGRVEAASEGLECGSEISVKLPLSDARPASQPQPEAAPAGSRRVLVIEDNVDAADTLTDALALSGHEVQVAYDGNSGISLAKSFRPEIVICDIGLPGMDGYAVAEAFQAEQELSDTFLIALTGYARPEDQQRATAAGFDEHVAKPPSLERLNQILSVVERRPHNDVTLTGK